MIIAKNDEDKRSRVWNYVTGITTVLIIIVAGYFIYVAHCPSSCDHGGAKCR